MKIKGLKVTVLNEADRTDPLNQLIVVGASAHIDNVLCGWKVTYIVGDAPDWKAAMELAIAYLIKQILTKTKNEIYYRVPPSPAIEFEVHDVPVAGD